MTEVQHTKPTFIVGFGCFYLGLREEQFRIMILLCELETVCSFEIKLFGDYCWVLPEEPDICGIQFDSWVTFLTKGWQVSKNVSWQTEKTCNSLCLGCHSAWPLCCLCTSRPQWQVGWGGGVGQAGLHHPRVPLPSLVKPECLSAWLPGCSSSAYPLPPRQTKSWLKQPGLPVAIVIGNTGSPPLENMFFFGIPGAVGFSQTPPQSPRTRIVYTLAFFCRRCRFLLCMIRFFSHTWICNHSRSRRWRKLQGRHNESAANDLKENDTLIADRKKVDMLINTIINNAFYY